MSKPDRANLTITLERKDGGYEASEPGSDVTAHGEDAHAAVINYAQRARAASEAQASD